MAVVLVLAPILGPVATAVHVDPVHWGVVFVLGTSIAFITLTCVLNLFVTSAVMGVSYAALVRQITQFVLILLFVWICVVTMPWMTLALLNN